MIEREGFERTLLNKKINIALGGMQMDIVKTIFITLVTIAAWEYFKKQSNKKGKE